MEKLLKAWRKKNGGNGTCHPIGRAVAFSGGHVFPVRAAIPVNLAIRATMHMEERSWMDDFNVSNPTPFF